MSKLFFQNESREKNWTYFWRFLFCLPRAPLVGHFGFFEKRTIANKMAPPSYQKFQSQTIVKDFHKAYICGKLDFFR